MKGRFMYILEQFFIDMAYLLSRNNYVILYTLSGLLVNTWPRIHLE